MARRIVFLAPLILLVCLLASAQGQTFNVCDNVTVNQGGSFTWNNPYTIQVEISPAPGTTWFLGQSYVLVDGNNGQTTINVPSTATPGTYDISVVYNNSVGGNPCAGGNGPQANPKIVIQPG